MGATAIATVGCQSEAAYLLDQYPGVFTPETVIVRDSSQFAGQLRTALASLKEAGFDILLDSLIGEYFQSGAQTAKIR